MAANDLARIPLPISKKRTVIIGAYFLWFYHGIFAQAIGILLPPSLARYDMLDMYAILSGIASLLAGIAVPIGGKLGDRFGRRRMCLIVATARVTLFTACAIPTNGTIFFILVCAGRMMGGVMASYCSTIISDVTGKEERPRWFGIYTGVNGVAYISGLTISGFLSDKFTSLTVFAIYMPLGVIGLILLALFFPNKPSSTPAPIDIPGMTLMTLGFAAILSWGSFGGKYFSRTSPLGLVLLIGGAIFLFFFIRVEKKASDPMLNLELFRMKPFLLCFGTSMLMAPFTQTFSTIFMLFGQETLGLSSTICGTLPLPKNIVFAILPPFAGFWIAKNLRRLKLAFFCTGFFLALGCLFGATWTASTPLWVIYLCMMLAGIGSCCQGISITPYSQMIVPQKDIGVASSMNTFANSFGVIVFNVVYNMVYNPRYDAAIKLGGGVHLSNAIQEIFTIMCLFSAGCALIIVVLSLTFYQDPIPKSKDS